VGEVCGAVSAGVLAIGLIYGQDQSEALSSAVSTKTREFVLRFADLNGALRCTDLTGVDMSSKKGVREYYDRKLNEEICYGVVSSAVKVLLEDLGD